MIHDCEGHYAPAAIALDRAAARQHPEGAHPIDAVAREMHREETRRRFFSRAAQGIGGLALASLLGETAHAEGVAEGDRKADPGLPAADLAALIMVTSQLLNLDEVLNQ